MYSFNVFEKAGIEPHANAIAYGIGANLLPTSSVAEYEEYMITNKGAEGSADLLIFEGASEEAVGVLAEAGYVDDGKGYDTLRYAALASLDSKGQKLLDDIEGIYADFDYPRDMDPSSTTCRAKAFHQQTISSSVIASSSFLRRLGSTFSLRFAYRLSWLLDKSRSV